MLLSEVGVRHPVVVLLDPLQEEALDEVGLDADLAVAAVGGRATDERWHASKGC
jgi:hypothetical protein